MSSTIKMKEERNVASLIGYTRVGADVVVKSRVVF